MSTITNFGPEIVSAEKRKGKLSYVKIDVGYYFIRASAVSL